LQVLGNIKSTDNGSTALMVASKNGHTDIIRILLNKGADVNVMKTNNGATALMMATMNCRADIVELLDSSAPKE
jgi:ankyrin repeat protein